MPLTWKQIEQGVKILRVDNPHTKPLPFWEWLLTEVRRTDRVVMEAVRQVLEPVYEPTFHASSHGFRPGPSAVL